MSASVPASRTRAYTKYLEEPPEVASYEACKALDLNRLNDLQKTDIRGKYFTQQWTSDFYISFSDGTVAVREIVRADARPPAAALQA